MAAKKDKVLEEARRIVRFGVRSLAMEEYDPVRDEEVLKLLEEYSADKVIGPIRRAYTSYKKSLMVQNEVNKTFTTIVQQRRKDLMSLLPD